MKLRRNAPRPPGAAHPLQIVALAALLLALAAALAVAAATGKL